MGVWSSSTINQKVKVWYLNNNKTIEYPSSITLKQLKATLDNSKISHKKIYLYFQWNLLTQKDDGKTLEKIISEEFTQYPHNQNLTRQFIAIAETQDQNIPLHLNNSMDDKLYHKLSQIQPVKQQLNSNYQLGAHGNLLFQERQSALLASSIDYALRKTNTQNQKLENIPKLLLQDQNSHLSLKNNFYSTLGLLKKASKNDQSASEMLERIKQQIKNQKDFSDFDPKFIYFIEQVYLKFMIKSLGKIHYINYETLDDFGIQTIPANSKIGIIGDFGTGLQDSFQLLRNMIQKHDVNVILHLGDVYYAGTPHQYQVSIIKPLNDLRISTKKQIRFYMIPGNHDYYSWGLPFICFIKSINSNQFQRQNASYFCLRDEENKWQFLGIDTSFYDSNPFNQIDPNGVGPHIKQLQLLWHKHRLNNFKGSTILLSHHQLFSIHQRINGRYTKYRNFSCLNPMLSAQLFEYFPLISSWFWGHQHSLMLFRQNLFGIQKCRLIGNSSFHVMFDKQHPYERNSTYPDIPFIVQDNLYYQKYLPINPNVQGQQYFGLSYAVINMQKRDQENNLSIQYWCSPCYSNEEFEKMGSMSQQQKKIVYFQEYRIFSQIIYSIQHKKKLLKPILSGQKSYLRCQIGLSLVLNSTKAQIIKESTNQLGNQAQDQKIYKSEISLKQNETTLNISGHIFQINILQKDIIQGKCTMSFTLKIVSTQNKKNFYICANTQGQILMRQINCQQDLIKNNAIWQTHYTNSQSYNQFSLQDIYYDIPIIINNKSLKRYLTWEIKQFHVYPVLSQQTQQQNIKKPSLETSQPKKQSIDNLNQSQNLKSFWMFYSQQNIKMTKSI